MNKTLTINLGGIVFHIDENAYDVFNAYVDSIRRHFASSEGKDEIMQDIEARIAEMFQQRIGDNKQVITLRDVEEVTATMGKPEQFGDAETEEAKTTTAFEGKTKRRLFRDPDDKILGGVCSGISAYFDIDPIWIRLALAVAIVFYGTGLLLYIILWIIIPEAKTTADKLMMRGEKITISNIEKNVREEFDELKKRFDETSGEVKEKIKQKDYSGFSGFLRRFFEGLGELLGFIFKVIIKIIGLFFVFIGLIVFITCLLAFLGMAGVTVVKFPHIMFSFFAASGLMFWAFVALTLVVGIPFLLLFYKGLRILFNIKQRSRAIIVPAISLMIAGWIIAVITGAAIARKYSEKGVISEEYKIIQPPSDTLSISIKNHSMDADEDETESINGWFMSSSDSTMSIAGPVQVDIKQSAGNNFELTKIVTSRGPSRRKAVENAESVSLSFSQTDNKLVLDNHYFVSKEHSFGFQKVKFIIGVPEGKTVYLERSLRDFLYNVQNTHNMYDYNMAPHYWKMTAKGLECTDCSSSTDESSMEDSDDNGSISIGSDDLDSVVINKHGIVIKKKGKDVMRINEKGMVIKNDEKN